MTRPPERAVPTGYRLRVDGHLDDHWSAWFDGLTLTHERDGTTSLSGVVADQAALHGLLMRVRDLGVTLISVELVDPSDESAPEIDDEVAPAVDEPLLALQHNSGRYRAGFLL